MKKLYYLLPLVLLAGCTKVAPDQEEVLVTFNVSSLDVEVQPMTKATAAAETEVTTIQYFLRNISTFKEYSGTQTKAAAGDDFGKFSLMLSPGTYAVNVLAYPGDKGSSVTLDQSNDRILAYDRDAFFKSTDANVQAGTDSYSVVLDRIVGQLSVHFNDDFSDFGSVKITIEGVKYSRQMMSESLSTLTTTVEKTLTVGANGACPDFSMFAFPQTMTLKIKLFDKSDVELGTTTKIIDVYKNRKTIVSGNLLDVLSGKEFAVQINDDWGTDNEVSL